MEFALLGWPAEGPTLRLDYRQFAYAGKFVVPATGKAVARLPEAPPAPAPDTAPPTGAGEGEDRPPMDAGDGGDRPPPAAGPEGLDRDVLAAASFDEDRADAGTLRVRYLTVRADRRGEDIGPRLAAFVADRAEQRGCDRARIAVNNPFAYEAAYKAGFAYTGRETGLAELVLEQPAERDAEGYRAGLAAFDRADRDLAPAERAFLRAKRGGGPPPLVTVPGSGGRADDAVGRADAANGGADAPGGEPDG